MLLEPRPVALPQRVEVSLHRSALRREQRVRVVVPALAGAHEHVQRVNHDLDGLPAERAPGHLEAQLAQRAMHNSDTRQRSLRHGALLEPQPLQAHVSAPDTQLDGLPVEAIDERQRAAQKVRERLLQHHPDGAARRAPAARRRAAGAVGEGCVRATRGRAGQGGPGADPACAPARSVPRLHRRPALPRVGVFRARARALL